MSKSDLAAAILSGFIARRCRRLAAGGLRILAYHRVLDDEPEEHLFDEELISATSAAFRRQMEFVRRHFEVVSFADLQRREQEGRTWPARAAIITFDDGYADNYTHAFPILKELGMPATIFLATDYIESDQLFWWDAVAYCFKQTSLNTVHLPAIGTLSLEDSAARRAAIDRVLTWIKRVPEATKNTFMECLPEALEVTLPSDLGRATHLSWAQVAEMARAGIEFGGHSVTHPILSNISPAQLEREISSSKQTIEAQLSRETTVFSYPDGNANAAVEEAVRNAGFTYATAYCEGVARPSGDRYTLPRIHVERDYSFALFEANLLFPGVMLRGGRR